MLTSISTRLEAYGYKTFKKLLTVPIANGKKQKLNKCKEWTMPMVSLSTDEIGDRVCRLQDTKF